MDRGLVHVHDGRADWFAQSDGLSGSKVNMLFEDREGSMWVATSNGLDRFRDVAAYTISAKQGLPGANVWSVLAARDGSVWLGSASGLSRWTDAHVTTFGKRDGLPDGGVHSLMEDAKGRVWATSLRGITYFENGKFIPLHTVPGGIVRSLGEQPGGNVWISGTDQGLLHVVGGVLASRIPWTEVPDLKGGTGSLLAADPVQGGLWLGRFQGGVAYFKDGRVRAMYASGAGLGQGRINDFQVDREGTLWAATEGGLSRLSKGQVSTLTSTNGLPCDAVESIVEDDARAWWLNMECGLVRITRPEVEAWTADPTHRLEVTVFDGSDGVASHATSSGFSPRAAKSRDGRLWFLSSNGVSVVDPRRIPVNSLPPPVHIEQVTADRKVYDVGSSLSLPPLVRDLQIDYTALSLVAPEKSLFKVKLEGRDRDWQDVGTRRQAFYSDLPPRSYRFRVIASNNSGVWNETGAVLDFSIAPAYYQTAWFRVFVVVGFLSLLWTAHRLRLRDVERHEAEIGALNERMNKAQEHERMRIAGELHDGVMQQISALTLMLGTAKRKMPSDSDARAEIGDVQQKLIQVGADVRQLSHGLHPAQLKDGGLPDALRAYCDEFGHVRGLSVSCDADDTVRDLSRGAALALYRIAQEALGNAGKHAAPAHIEVRLTRSNDSVSLTVSDNGAGCETSRIGASGGLGLVSMRERARQLNGTFAFDSTPGRGTTVTVTIPFR
jgi:signal transduction histidine kinase